MFLTSSGERRRDRIKIINPAFKTVFILKNSVVKTVLFSENRLDLFDLPVNYGLGKVWDGFPYNLFNLLL